MNFVVKIFRRFHEYQRFWGSAWRVRAFLLSEKPFLKQIQMGAGVRFNVPVRCGGAGSLVVGFGSSFGDRSAPLFGRGEILLQPRNIISEISIGEFSVINNNVTIIANERIVIGHGCLIGDQASIYDCDFHEIEPATRARSPGPTRPVTIGNNVWLGSRVVILKGVTIGDNSVIGAMSLVTKSIPENCVAAGNPAKVIRFIY